VSETEIVTEISKILFKIMRDFIINIVHSNIYGDKAKNLKW
jgi:hypothetical protein